ncbi:MAG: hypothetical protein D6808_03375, partial [Candidatus Dadabacteria bacterium]
MGFLGFNLLSFGSPWMLSLIPAALATLLYAYLKGGRKRRFIAPTLFLLRKLASEAVSSRKITLPPRFFLELLVATLLIGALSNPSVKSKGKLIAVLIDNSFSMFSITPSGLSFMEIAKRDLKTFLNSVSSDTRFYIAVTSPSPRFLTGDPVSAEKAQLLAEAVMPTYAPDNIEDAMRFVSAKSGIDSCAIFSDRIPQEGQNSGFFTYHSGKEVLERGSNIWISEASLKPESRGKVEIKLTLSSDSEIKLKGSIQTRLYDSPLHPAVFQKGPRENFTLYPNRSLPLHIKAPSAKGYEVRITITEDKSAIQRDSIKEDNI